MEVAIAGGGLAGLVTARHLAERGHDATIYEASDAVGGRVTTTREDGFVLDRGFQVLFTAYPAVQEELDLSALDLRRFKPGATIARPGERSTLSDPLRDPAAAVETLLNREVRFADKLRVFRLQRELSGRDPGRLLDDERQSIEGYLGDRGFSRAFVENFARPFYGGITLSRDLDTDAGVFEYTFKMLSEGRIAVPADGMVAIPEQLAANARTTGATIETDTEVTKLEADGDAVDLHVGGERVEADAAVVATDPRTAAELTDIDTPTARLSCVTQHVALSDHDELDTGRRILLNAIDNRPNTVAQMSAVAPEYAPDDRTLLAATFLGERDESDAELGEYTREALASWYPEHRFDDFEIVRTDRVRFAQFPQPPGFRSSLPAVDDPDGAVVLAGDYTRWSSIQGAMESGKRAAKAIAAWSE